MFAVVSTLQKLVNLFIVISLMIYFGKIQPLLKRFPRVKNGFENAMLKLVKLIHSSLSKKTQPLQYPTQNLLLPEKSNKLKRVRFVSSNLTTFEDMQVDTNEFLFEDNQLTNHAFEDSNHDNLQRDKRGPNFQPW